MISTYSYSMCIVKFYDIGRNQIEVIYIIVKGNNLINFTCNRYLIFQQAATRKSGGSRVMTISALALAILALAHVRI